jgi:hypothetical protein
MENETIFMHKIEQERNTAGIYFEFQEHTLIQNKILGRTEESETFDIKLHFA